MSTHGCPSPGCTEQVPFERFSCSKHWFSIPKPLRDDLWRAWKYGTAEQHLEVREACVRFLEEKAA